MLSAKGITLLSVRAGAESQRLDLTIGAKVLLARFQVVSLSKIRSRNKDMLDSDNTQKVDER